MRDPAARATKYKHKVRGLVIPGQKKRFRGAVDRQVEAELFVKTLGLPSVYQNYYTIFAKEVLAIKAKHSGQLAQDEACLLQDRWISRGLDTDSLEAILDHYGLGCITPIENPFTLDVSLLDGTDQLV